ncbi:MAG: hypothetical protein M3Z25_08760 [Actinomycetota bacterium]|nr:hypothetical protein [Actinomycetota bacterium]
MLSIEEFGRLFENVERSAWRLLTLDSYDVIESEQTDFAEWQRTGRASDRAGEPWLRMIEDYARRGVPFARTHVFPGSDQLTPYCEYVLESYEANDAAGERVSIADRSAHPELTRLDTDFWLLDDRAVVIEYDDERHYTGAYLADDDHAGRLREQQTLVARWAVPLSRYKAGRRGRQPA